MNASETPPPERPPQPRRPLPWNQLAEERIQQAHADGQFDNLPGFGRPIPGIDEPHDDLWWVKDKLKREQLSSLPPALAIRLDVEQTLARIAALNSECEVRQQLAALNKRIATAGFGVTWGPPVDVQPLDIDEQVATWRAGRDGETACQ